MLRHGRAGINAFRPGLPGAQAIRREGPSKARAAQANLPADLAELCRGAHPGRRARDEVTVFKSVGWAGEDLAAAVLAYGRHAAGRPGGRG